MWEVSKRPKNSSVLVAGIASARRWNCGRSLGFQQVAARDCSGTPKESIARSVIEDQVAARFVNASR